MKWIEMKQQITKDDCRSFDFCRGHPAIRPAADGQRAFRIRPMESRDVSSHLHAAEVDEVSQREPLVLPRVTRFSFSGAAVTFGPRYHLTPRRLELFDVDRP
jgi:hypothetical protein